MEVRRLTADTHNAAEALRGMFFNAFVLIYLVCSKEVLADPWSKHSAYSHFHLLVSQARKKREPYRVGPITPML